MNNRLIKKLIGRSLIWGTTFSIIGSLASCDKFLDRAPLDQISTPEFWKTPQELDAYIIGLYDWLPGQLSSSGMGYYVADQNSDDMVLATTYNKFMNGENTTTPASGGAWNWTAIRQINTFFDNYKRCPAPFEQYQQTYGEACFLKALRYHGLVAAFGDVPWYSHVISDKDTTELYKPRDSRALVVDSIMALIDQAIVNLKPRAVTGVNRINKETALIYKSRVALYEATWAKYHAGTPSKSSVDANKLFQQAIDAYNQFKTEFGGFQGKLHTADGPEKSYYNLFGQFDYKNIPEVTLSKNYSQALGVTNQVGYIVWLYGYGGNSYSLDLAKSYLKNDGTSIDITDENVINTKGVASLTQMAGLLDPRFRQSVFIPGDLINNNTVGYKDSLFTVPQMHTGTVSNYTVTGFAPKKAHNPNSTLQGNYIDPEIAGIAFRIPELMLNYVEAYVELNGTFPDLSDNIDLLRQRVGMPTLTQVKPVVTSLWPDYGYPVSDELAIVRQERRVELAGEGYRTSDWKRWRAHKLFDGKRPRGYQLVMTDYDKYTTKPSVPVDNNGRVDPYQASLPNGYQFNADRDYLSPLPIDDLLRNKKLVQNPFWDSPE